MPSGAPSTDLWSRLEPLLPQVQKPARYIGCEDGMQTPEHGPDKTSWLFTYPDTYEIGLPNAGLQILYEIICLLYTSPSPRDRTRSRMPSSA